MSLVLKSYYFVFVILMKLTCLSRIKLFFPCHTEALAEVSIKLRRRFFALNLKCVLNSLDFSLVSLTQNDKGLFAILSATEYLFLHCHTELCVAK